MKRVEWADRQVGDVCLSAPEPLSGLAQGIHDAELDMHPLAPRDFIPTHAFIVGPTDPNFVTESFLGEEPTGWVNSVAAITEASKYDTGYKVEVWRPEPTGVVLAVAFDQYLQQWHDRRYGWANLLGFEYVAMVKELFDRSAANPVLHSRVCSQGVMMFLGRFCRVPWAAALALPPQIDNIDPLRERMIYLALHS